jgi:hypothetical protein
VAGVIILALAAWVAYWSHIANKPSNILDFRRSAFQAETNARFFYSIGNQLKNADYLNPKRPPAASPGPRTGISGRFDFQRPSPWVWPSLDRKNPNTSISRYCEKLAV